MNRKVLGILLSVIMILGCSFTVYARDLKEASEVLMQEAGVCSEAKVTIVAEEEKDNYKVIGNRVDKDVNEYVWLGINPEYIEDAYYYYIFEQGFINDKNEFVKCGISVNGQGLFDEYNSKVGVYGKIFKRDMLNSDEALNETLAPFRNGPAANHLMIVIATKEKNAEEYKVEHLYERVFIESETVQKTK